MSLRPYIYDASPQDLERWVREQGLPAYRLKQLMAWLPRGLMDSQDISDFSKDLRARLAEAFRFDGLTVEARLPSAQDGTVKYVFALADGHRVETVLMRYETGNSICLSTQSGCRMGCRFCASTGIGFGRNLTAGELFAQVALIARLEGLRISHVVLMGIGEPLENYEAVLAFIRWAIAPEGLGISQRHISLSTCGLVPEIERLAEEDLALTLAISLHAPDDALRKSLMPIAGRYPLDQLMGAVRHYIARTHRRVTFEYALFDGVNDGPAQATAVARLLRGLLCHVNLIPGNEFPGGHYRRSRPEAIKAFRQRLEQGGIPCTVRRELGSDIAAACGQLRRTRERT